MATASGIFLEYVCPTLGMIVSNLMFLAPLRDLQAAVSNGTGLKSLNPTPWAFMLGNCLGWTAYGVLANDWFVFWSDFPGFLVSFWLNLGAVKLLYSSHHQQETRESLVAFLAEYRRETDDDNKENDESSLLQQEQEDENSNGTRENVHDDIVDSKRKQDESWRNEKRGRERNIGNDDSNQQRNDYEDGSIPRSEDDICDFDGDDIEQNRKEIKNRSLSTAPVIFAPLEQSVGETANRQPKWGEIVWKITSQKTPAKTPHERLVMGMVLLWTVVLSFLGFYSHFIPEGGRRVAIIGVGYVVNINMIFFYGAPLSRISSVLKTKTSDVLHLPTMVTNSIHSVLWTAYAAAPQINDPFIYVPCGMGVIFGIAQIALWVVFPMSEEKRRRDQKKVGSPRSFLSSFFALAPNGDVGSTIDTYSVTSHSEEGSSEL